MAEKAVDWVEELLASVEACHDLPWESIPEAQMKEVARHTLETALAEQNPRKANDTEIISMVQDALQA